MKAYRTDDGIEIRDGDEVLTKTSTWPPSDADKLDTLFNNVSISTPQKELFKILFGVVEPIDERSDSEQS